MDVAADAFKGRKLGPYLLEGLLGKGGMGTVYRASHEDGRVVAVKVLPIDEETASSTMAARFKREIAACRDTGSTHVIRVYDAGVEEDCHWYSMELLEGKTLQQLLKKQGRLPMDEVVRICRELSEALQHIHDRGIIHRDLKPGNIMILRSGRTVLMDFGLAKVEDRTRITKTGHGLGTPRYMAPEMLLARPPSPATDIYQVGVILYEMLTGETVVKAKSFATLAHELTRVYPPDLTRLDPSISPDLDALVFNCLEKDQKKRYQSAKEFVTDLDRYVAGKPVERRGEKRVLRLGEEPDEVDDSAATAVTDLVSGLTPAPPDSRRDLRRPSGVRPSGGRPSASRPRASASFASAAPEPAPVLPPYLRPLQSPLGLGGIILGGLAVLLWLAFPRWEGDTRLGGTPQLYVSPSGAQIEFQTLASVPGAIRLYRFLGEGPDAELDDRTRPYQAADDEPRRSHRVILDRLVEGRRYAAEVLFPDGSSHHRLEFRVPTSEALEDVRLDRVSAEKVELRFRLDFPVGGAVRQGDPDSEEGVPLEGPMRSEWRIPIPVRDPFQPVRELYLDLTGAAGWSRRFGPYDFAGLDGQVAQRLEDLDVEAILEAVASLQGEGSRLLLALREQLKEKKVNQVLQILRPHASHFFRSQELAFDRRRNLLRALQRLEPVDFLCEAEQLPPLLGISKLYVEMMATRTRTRFENQLGDRIKDVQVVEVDLAAANEVLRPVGVSPDAYRPVTLRARTWLGFLAASFSQHSAEFRLPRQLPGAVDLDIQVSNLYPETYLEVLVNGEVQVLLHNPDRNLTLGDPPRLGREPKQLIFRRAANLPLEALRGGRNEVLVRLHRMGKVPEYPTRIERLAVYYRRGGV